MRRAVTDWVYVSLPMLAVVAFVAVTFLAGAVWTDQDAFAAESDAPIAQEVPERVGAHAVPQESGAAGRLETAVLISATPTPAIDSGPVASREPRTP